MKYCIAMDGGGTKTDAVLFDETGKILALETGPGSNVTDLGEEESRTRVLDMFQRVLRRGPDRVDALYGAIAGAIVNGDPYSGTILGTGRIGTSRIEDDGPSILSSTLGLADGCAMICGTGSSLFVRIEGEPLRHIGGKGYLIDTGGSGFELGRNAIRTALRAADGRIPPTALTGYLEEIIGESVDDHLIPILHHRGRAYIASLAPAVFRAREDGDPAAIGIFERQSALLADLTYPAARFFPGGFPVVIGGGIAAHYPEYVEAIREKCEPRAKLIASTAPPLFGAAVLALHDAGTGETEAFRTRFLADLDRLTGRRSGS